jgi:CRISPR-associated protein Cas2
MWVMAAFDLPTQTTMQKKRHSTFRKFLLGLGFTMMQFSVYVKNVSTYRQAESLMKQVGDNVPAEGKCACVPITDKQYGLTKNYYGRKSAKEKLPQKYQQLVLFD